LRWQQSEALNARLLFLANHVGDRAVLLEALSVARDSITEESS